MFATGFVSCIKSISKQNGDVRVNIMASDVLAPFCRHDIWGLVTTMMAEVGRRVSGVSLTFRCQDRISHK